MARHRTRIPRPTRRQRFLHRDDCAHEILTLLCDHCQADPANLTVQLERPTLILRVTCNGCDRLVQAFVLLAMPRDAAAFDGTPVADLVPPDRRLPAED